MAIEPSHRRDRVDTANTVYWDADDIQHHCRLSRSSAWRLIKTARGFPAPVVLGPKQIVWPRAEVIAFMEARRRASHYRTKSPPGEAIARGAGAYVSRVRTKPRRR